MGLSWDGQLVFNIAVAVSAFVLVVELVRAAWGGGGRPWYVRMARVLGAYLVTVPPVLLLIFLVCSWCSSK